MARVNVLPKGRDDEGRAESIPKRKLPRVACDHLSTPPAVTGRRGSTVGLFWCDSGLEVRTEA